MSRLDSVARAQHDEGSAQMIMKNGAAAAPGTPDRRRTHDRRIATRTGAAPGPVRREEYVRRVREALAAEYFALAQSPLTELPGVVTLARSDYSRKIYPTASALRDLLDRALDLALAEVEGCDEKRLQQVTVCLRLMRQHTSIPSITEHLGLHSESYVRTRIRRQALELVTDAFLQLARKCDESNDDRRNVVAREQAHARAAPDVLLRNTVSGDER